MKITHLFAGKPKAFGPRGSPSSIIKQACSTLHIEINGAIEDEQGNKKLHGGPQMALHQYAQGSYETLQKQFPAIANKLSIGTIGENISAEDMHEENVFIGDIYAYGEVKLQVSSPRAPCAKINQRYQTPKIDSYILTQGITGWYFRVIETGTLRVGDKIHLLERDEQSFSVKEIMFMSKFPPGYHAGKAKLEQASRLKSLAPEWQAKLKRKARG